MSLMTFVSVGHGGVSIFVEGGGCQYRRSRVVEVGGVLIELLRAAAADGGCDSSKKDSNATSLFEKKLKSGKLDMKLIERDWGREQIE